jgi:hypothetical protein
MLIILFQLPPTADAATASSTPIKQQPQKNGFAAPPKKKKNKNLSQNSFIFRLFLFSSYSSSSTPLLLPSDTYYSLSPAPDAPHFFCSFINSINPATSQTDFATNEFYKRAAKNASRAEDSDTRSYGSLVGSRLYLVGLV